MSPVPRMPLASSLVKQNGALKSTQVRQASDSTDRLAPETFLPEPNVSRCFSSMYDAEREYAYEPAQVISMKNH
jgi:hypothetical protein